MIKDIENICLIISITLSIIGIICYSCNNTFYEYIYFSKDNIMFIPYHQPL